MAKNLKTVEPTELATPQAANPMQAAIQAGASPAELLQFMELQERWEANEARKAYTAAMTQFRADCPTILKTEKAHNSTYAGLAGTLSQIKTLMSGCGFSHSWRTQQDGNGITVTCVITHSQGHSEETSLTAPPDTSGSKNNIQALGSTCSYLERYTLVAALGLTSSDSIDDDGQAAGQVVARITDEQALTIHSMITDNDLNLDRFMGWIKSSLKVGSIEDINVNAYPHVLEKIKTTIKAKQNADG